MERCERCEKVFDIKQDEGDYVYYRSENDSIPHTFCNACLEITDYNEPDDKLKAQDKVEKWADSSLRDS